MSRNQMHMLSLDWMVKESIGFIQKHEPPEGYFVGFSGGKDSIVTLELVRMAGVKHEAFYAATGIDPPEVVRFIRENYPTVKFCHPKMTFWEGVYLKSPPLRTQRWCCDVLKKSPTNRKDFWTIASRRSGARMQGPYQNRVMGIRAEESLARAGRPRVDFVKKYKQWIYKPIFGWKEWHVWDFIEERKLKYCCLYDEGFDRLG